MRRAATLLALFLLTGFTARAASTLDIYFIDVEGGQATLVVSPSGASMLVDTGWPGFGGRDASRIAAAAKTAGINHIDYLLITHYHADHVGGVPQLVRLLPVSTFIDHSVDIEHGPDADKLTSAYAAARGASPHLEAKPGETIPLAGVGVQILTAAGERITDPLPGAGAANPECAATKLKEADPSENARSNGVLVAFGKFRFIDLGDLTWNKEYDLVCPRNLIGTVDVYLSTHHGLDQSGGPEIVHALRPRVAIMNNGAHKGGSAAAWDVIESSPGLENLWQIHYAVAGGSAHNVAPEYIANPDGAEDRGFGLKVSARKDGGFSVTNERSGETRTYAPRAH